MRNKPKLSIVAQIGCILLLLSGIIPEEIILGIQVLALLVFSKNKIKYQKSFIIIIFLITVHSIFNIILGNSSIILYAKAVIGISVSYFFYYNCYIKEDVHSIAKLYIKIAIVISLVVILQQIGWFFKILFIYDLSWLVPNQLPSYHVNGVYRAAAFFREPSECALILSPAAFLAINTLLEKTRKNKDRSYMSVKSAFLILLGFLLIFSSIGYFGLIIAFLLIFLDYKLSFKQIGIVVVTIIVSVGLYINVPEFSMRIDDTIDVIFYGTDLSSANLSSSTLIINQRIAFKNLKESFLLGTGIGSHQVAYSRYINQVSSENLELYLNQEDSNSLLLRMLSELGLPSVILAIFFLFHFRPKEMHTKNKQLSNACLVYILLRFLRYGHYFNAGLWMFVIMYMLIYLASCNSRNETKRMLKIKIGE